MNTAETTPTEEDIQVLPGDIRLQQDVEESEQEEGSPQALYAKSRDLRKGRRYAEAEKSLQEILKHPTEEVEDCCKAMVFADLAQLAYWAGRYKEAEGYANQVLRLKDDQSDTLAYEILARVAIARFDFNTARLYQNRLVRNPVVYSLISCFLSLQKGDVSAAQQSLVRVAEEGGSRDPEYQTYQAYLAMLKGESRSVLPLARALVEEEETSPVLMLMAAEVLLDAGDYSAVQGVLRDLEFACAENDRFLVLQARLALKKKIYGQAEACAKQALEVNPDNEHAQAVIMRCELEEQGAEALGQVPEAGEQRQKVLVLVLEREA